MGVCCTLPAALGLFISSGLAQDATAAQTSSKIDPTPYTVQERALNHRVMSRVIQTTDADGKSITKTNSYTELATGLHYLQDGKLVESKAEITLLPQGGAAATQGQHKAYFPANLNGGVIDLVMPDGRELKAQIRGLGYYDKASGKNVILAEALGHRGHIVSAQRACLRKRLQRRPGRCALQLHTVRIRAGHHFQRTHCCTGQIRPES